ncbi:MAG: DNA adenine methylase, partial [Elusimicrobia bacterium]|nr:DNA adenine methylase [Elusimicrobiota bacterium]
MESEAPPFCPHVEDGADLEKVQAAFKSPGGKYRLYKKIIALMPEHKTFVEGFCGGAQVFFHKKRSGIEAINDVNSDLIFAYRFIKSMEPKDLEWLKKQNWVISRGRARKVFEMKPATPRERFYRFAYLNKSTYWGRTDVWEGVRTGPKGEGYRIKLVDRLPDIQDRLKGVRLHSWDWKEVIKEYDAKDAFFYLDPPYPLHWPKEGGGHGSKFFKEEEMIPVLKNIKGRFILSYELEKVGIFKGFKTYRVKTLWTGMHQLGVRSKYELLVANFVLKTNNFYVENF